MPWSLSNADASQRLKDLFTRHRIPFDTPGFFDEPNFLVQERIDPRFLEHYARYVETRAYTGEYLEGARRKVDVAAEAVRAAVEGDGRLGACVDASCMLGRMLDRLGVWNYVAKATLTISFPTATRLAPRYFWGIDQGNFVAPHAIVVAPPYCVVDVTVHYQPYDARQVPYLPSIVLTDEFERAQWAPEDLANHELLAALRRSGVTFDQFLQRQYPSMSEVTRILPPRNVTINGTGLKYVVVAVGGFIEPLEECKGYKPCGRTALEIFEEDIHPQFRLNDA